MNRHADISDCGVDTVRLRFLPSERVHIDPEKPPLSGVVTYFEFGPAKQWVGSGGRVLHERDAIPDSSWWITVVSASAGSDNRPGLAGIHSSPEHNCDVKAESAAPLGRRAALTPDIVTPAIWIDHGYIAIDARWLRFRIVRMQQGNVGTGRYPLDRSALLCANGHARCKCKEDNHRSFHFSVPHFLIGRGSSSLYSR